MSKDLSKDVLGAIKKKTGKNISENSVKKVAGTVSPDVLQNQEELRKLVKRVAEMANIKLTDARINDITQTIQSSGVSISGIETLMKVLMK